MMKLAISIVLFALAAPSYTASLRESSAKAAAATSDDEVSRLMNKLLLIRKARALPDGTHGGLPGGAGGPPGVPVDAAFPAEQALGGKDDSSSSDIDSLIAALEAQIAELMGPPTTAISPAEAGAEAQEQAPQPDPSQPDQPDPAQPDPKGPDGSNTEDGDGDGNNGQQNNQQDGNQNGIDNGNEDTK